MRPGPDEPFLLQSVGRADWDRARQRFGLESPALDDFVGLSLEEYADYQMRYGHTEPGPPAIVSTIKIAQAGFHEVMDTELMFRKWFQAVSDKASAATSLICFTSARPPLSIYSVSDPLVK